MLYSTYTIGEEREENVQSDEPNWAEMGMEHMIDSQESYDHEKHRLFVQFDLNDVKRHMENTISEGDTIETVTVVFFDDHSAMMIVDDPHEFAELREKAAE